MSSYHNIIVYEIIQIYNNSVSENNLTLYFCFKEYKLLHFGSDLYLIDHFVAATAFNDLSPSKTRLNYLLVRNSHGIPCIINCWQLNNSCACSFNYYYSPVANI